MSLIRIILAHRSMMVALFFLAALVALPSRAHAQVAPWDEPPAAPSAAQNHPLTFSDLQQSMHDYNTGKGDAGFRNGILTVLAVVGLVALVVHLRQRHKSAGPPDSIHRLGRELGGPVRFPLASRWLLRWVARSARVPFASLLLSSGLFDRCVQDWAQQPTFSVARSWGKSRLDRLRSNLFD